MWRERGSQDRELWLWVLRKWIQPGHEKGGGEWFDPASCRSINNGPRKELQFQHTHYLHIMQLHSQVVKSHLKMNLFVCSHSSYGRLLQEIKGNCSDWNFYSCSSLQVREQKHVVLNKLSHTSVLAISETKHMVKLNIMAIVSCLEKEIKTGPKSWVYKHVTIIQRFSMLKCETSHQENYLYAQVFKWMGQICSMNYLEWAAWSAPLEIQMANTLPYAHTEAHKCVYPIYFGSAGKSQAFKCASTCISQLPFPCSI